MRFVVAAALALVFSAGAMAEPFRVDALTVNGLQRVSLGSVLQALPIQEGDQVDTESADDWLRAVYSTGYFSDVQVLREGNTLIFEVTERPAINTVDFSGNKVIPTETLERVMSGVGLEEGEIFNQSLLEGIELELERQYSIQGRYNATVVPEVTPLSLNRVDVELVISEGPV
ncbi:MAG: POTRA domain-containing protein, partial [Saccharospirillum sp.]